MAPFRVVLRVSRSFSTLMLCILKETNPRVGLSQNHLFKVPYKNMLRKPGRFFQELRKDFINES